MEAYPYLILDARHEQVPDNGEIGRQAALIAIGINWKGDRQALAVGMANREREQLERLPAAPEGTRSVERRMYCFRR